MLFLLKSNIGSESQALQDQIKSKLISADQVKAAELVAAGEEKAQKLITLLSNNANVTKMRKDGQFNFDALSKGVNKITISDCQNLFDFSKLLFETQKYENAHHYLFILKEILGTQTNTHYQLVSQVFWGLFACEI